MVANKTIIVSLYCIILQVGKLRLKDFPQITDLSRTQSLHSLSAGTYQHVCGWRVKGQGKANKGAV